MTRASMMGVTGPEARAFLAQEAERARALLEDGAAPLDLRPLAEQRLDWLEEEARAQAERAVAIENAVGQLTVSVLALTAVTRAALGHFGDDLDRALICDAALSAVEDGPHAVAASAVVRSFAAEPPAPAVPLN